VTVFLFIYPPLFVVHGQTSGLKVIVTNEGQGRTVCVSPELGCNYIGSGETREFEYSPNEVQVGEEFRVCLNGICKTGINSPENSPEYVYFESKATEENGPREVIDEESSSSSSARAQIIAIFLLVLFSGIVILIYKLRRRKSRRRRNFTADIIRETFKKQDYKCSICRKGITTKLYDKHHKDGNRANSNASNLQLLCVTCHAKINRGLLEEEEREEKRRSKWKSAAVGIIVLFIIIWGLWALNN
jgi:hypothetical protein